MKMRSHGLNNDIDSSMPWNKLNVDVKFVNQTYKIIKGKLNNLSENLGFLHRKRLGNRCDNLLSLEPWTLGF